MDLKLNGKLAVVLGASRGLGGAIAQMLAKEGSSVIAVARNTSSIDEWSKSYPISSYKCDLTSTNDVNELISFLSIKKISILIKKGAKFSNELKRIKDASKLASANGIEVHAGHGLDYKTTKILKKISYIKEFNIGHFIIGESLESGMSSIIKKFKKIVR